MTRLSSVRFGDIEVFYEPDLDGGGSFFGDDYVPFLRERLGPVESVYEWCAGPGFIGFAILAAGLCERLCLSDVNPRAIRCVEKTIRENGLGGIVDVFESDCFDQIPSSEKWDLVVGNPPHSGKPVELQNWGHPLIYMDEDWALHRRFFGSVRERLKPGGQVILQENYYCSNPATFEQMIEASGLKIRSVSAYPVPAQFIYYLWLNDPQTADAAERNEHWAFSVRDFDFRHDAHRHAERHFREDAGLSVRPAMACSEEIMQYRRIVLDGDALTRQHLADRHALVQLRGERPAYWLISGEGDRVALTKHSRLKAYSREFDCQISMEHSLFVDLYEHRISLTAAIAQETVFIDGDQRLARLILSALLRPSDLRLPPGENAR